MHVYQSLMASRVRNLVMVSFSCFVLLTGTSNSETDTLMQGQKLIYGDQLVSNYGIFTFGFFRKLSYDNKGYGIYKYYLGIWYRWSVTKSPRSSEDSMMVVWVANRNTPVYDRSGVLTIGTDGYFKIVCSGRDPIVLTSSSVSGNISAILLDSGNLVLHELNSDGSLKHVLWQSFDHPTDILLPGMKIGVNLKTGHNWSLTSWTEIESPATGSFTFGMDPSGTNQLIIWWAGNVYWSSETFVNGSFNFSNELSEHHYYFSYFSNDSEKYFTYHVNDDTNSFPMIGLSSFGSLVVSDQPLIVCRKSFGCAGEAYDVCNDDPIDPWQGDPSPFFLKDLVHVNFSDGCVDKKYPICRKDLSQIFKQSGSVSGDAFKFNDNENLNIMDCREKCLRNCSCVAFAIDSTGCQIWSKVNIRKSTYENQQSIYVLESKENKHVAENKQLQGAGGWLVIVVAGALGMTLLCFLCFLIWRKFSGCLTWLLKLKNPSLIWREYEKKFMHFLQSIKKTRTEQEILLSELGIDSKHKSDRHGKSGLELQFFKFESISSATSNFAPMNKLGQGGFGPVYKGLLPDGQEVAIKRLSANSRQGLVEFKNEVKVIAKLQHNNLVRLVGCCIEKEEKILIYEYMPNKSLDFLLFDPMSQNLLDWKKRFGIIEGIAQGLLYLHKHSRLKIIHRDLKASNILLDSEMNPKISDFGMAKIFGPEESKANTNRVAGTFGYMSPEYAIEGIYSTKSDVYSFGLLLLEIISGRRNNSFHHSDGPLNLAVHAWELWRQGRDLELIDPRIGGECQNEVLRLIHVSLLCVQADPIDRPNMLDVLSMLYNEAYQLPCPKQPAFYNRRSVSSGAGIEEHKQGNWSLNEVSITEMEAR